MISRRCSKMACARALEGLTAGGPSLFRQNGRTLVFSAHSYRYYYKRTTPKMSMGKFLQLLEKDAFTQKIRLIPFGLGPSGIYIGGIIHPLNGPLRMLVTAHFKIWASFVPNTPLGLDRRLFCCYTVLYQPAGFWKAGRKLAVKTKRGAKQHEILYLCVGGRTRHL